MMKKTLLSILLIFIVSMVGCNKKEGYDLQEKCGKRCEEFSKNYKEKYSLNKLSYTSHYNKKLNKCFILLESFKIYNHHSLWEVNENKEYGFNEFGNIPTCWVIEKKCKSTEEWDTLVRPLMTE